MTISNQPSSKSSKRYEKTTVPGVYKRGGRYVYKYRDENNAQRQGSERTLRDAQRAKSAANTAVTDGNHQVPTKLKFAEYARRVLRDYTGRTKSGFRETTRDSYVETLERHIIPFFGNRRLSSITTPDIKAFLHQMNTKEHPREPGHLLGESTIRYTMQVLKIIFAVAVEDGVLQRSPARAVRVNITQGNGAGRRPAGLQRARALTRDELVRFLRALPSDFDRLLFRTLVALGLRIGELQELRVSDITFGPRPFVAIRRGFTRRKGFGVIVSAPKTRAGFRDIPLPHRLAAELELFTEGRDPDALVFSARRGGYIDRPNYHARILKPAATKAGVSWVSFHSFRHTCASFLFATPVAGDGRTAPRIGGGKNVKQVQEWLGHSDPGFTLSRYVHLLDDGVGGADFFDELL